MADTNQLKISRKKLAEFIPDNDTIKRFERLFTVTADLDPNDITAIYALIRDLTIGSASVGASATQALDAISSLGRALELASTQPAFSLPRAIALDYLDFDQTPSYTPQTARLCWSATDDTLNLHQSGGVVQQVGQELFGRITNNGAATLANGAVIGLNAAGLFVPYIADGSLSTLNVLGVATESIAVGAKGRFTVWGVINDIDTTGSAAGEAWAVGDVLYVSPVTAGYYTKVKPTAPRLSIPIGRVETVSATAGQISVRPIYEQQRYYGQFFKTEDQSPAAVNTPYPITWSSTGAAVGVSLGTPASRIVAANAGLYRFNASFQLTSSSVTVKNVWIWYRKNGVDLANTAQITSLESGTAISAPSRSFVISMAAGDYVEIVFAADSVNVTIDAIPATSFAPAAPAGILSVSQEQQ